VGNNARFNYPSAVAVDGAGDVYVADSGNSTIRKLTATGIVTTLAGLVQLNADGTPVTGALDGTGSAARFFNPQGVAVDTAGFLYVADTANHTIRKVSPMGVVTTLAGLAGSKGRVDGVGAAARFYYPRGVALDSAGTLYVADTLNGTIRKVTPDGVVSTLAGLAGSFGSADGAGSNARFGGSVNSEFGGPTGLGVDGAGNIYAADMVNNTIRKVTPAGVVTTLAGLAQDANGAPVTGSTDGTGSDARFGGFPPGSLDFYRGPAGVTVDPEGNLYVADTGNNTIRKGTPALRILNSHSSVLQFEFMLTGPAGQRAVVEASTDLVSWLPLWTNTLAGPLLFTNSESVAYSKRFYRARGP
jgi:sugar lactone lactonase YvrE